MRRVMLGRVLSVAALTVLAVFVTSDGLLAGKPGGGPGGPGGGGQTGTIVGEVFGPSGPVGGATVMLFDGVAIDQVAETTTDADGNFRFNKVKEGSYTVTAISLDPPCSGSTPVTVVAKKQVVVIVSCQ